LEPLVVQTMHTPWYSAQTKVFVTEKLESANVFLTTMEFLVNEQYALTTAALQEFALPNNSSPWMPTDITTPLGMHKNMWDAFAILVDAVLTAP